MAIITVGNIPDLVGTEIGRSRWRPVTQQMIDLFADATDDHQWIHVDAERAARETPFGGTIAHGFLLLSLLTTLAYEALPTLRGVTMDVNYGFDKVRFMTPVKAGARVRAIFTLASADIRPSGRVVNTYDVKLEIENYIKPALAASWVTISVVDTKELPAGVARAR